eukprot:4290694-Amphidinium_carterae.1
MHTGKASCYLGAWFGLKWPAGFKRSAPGRPDKAWYYKQVLYTALNRDAYDFLDQLVDCQPPAWFQRGMKFEAAKATLLQVDKESLSAAERAGGSSEVLVLDPEEAEAGQEAEAGEEAAEAG